MLWTPGKDSRHPFFMFFLLLPKWKNPLCLSTGSFQLSKSNVHKGLFRQETWQATHVSTQIGWCSYAPQTRNARVPLMHLLPCFSLFTFHISVSSVLITHREKEEEGIPLYLRIPLSAARSHHKDGIYCLPVPSTRTTLFICVSP